MTEPITTLPRPPEGMFAPGLTMRRVEREPEAVCFGNKPKPWHAVDPSCDMTFCGHDCFFVTESGHEWDDVPEADRCRTCTRALRAKGIR